MHWYEAITRYLEGNKPLKQAPWLEATRYWRMRMWDDRSPLKFEIVLHNRAMTTEAGSVDKEYESSRCGGRHTPLGDTDGLPSDTISVICLSHSGLPSRSASTLPTHPRATTTQVVVLTSSGNAKGAFQKDREDFGLVGLLVKSPVSRVELHSTIAILLWVPLPSGRRKWWGCRMIVPHDVPQSTLERAGLPEELLYGSTKRSMSGSAIIGGQDVNVPWARLRTREVLISSKEDI
nr:hypothetical protein CFP56_02819 [Quercus suber]